jgi:hypothetical protein
MAASDDPDARVVTKSGMFLGRRFKRKSRMCARFDQLTELQSDEGLSGMPAKVIYWKCQS